MSRPSSAARRSHPTRRTLTLVAVCVAFLFQGTRGLYETTEGRYAEVGREMVASGDWMVPHLDGHPHWTKPPLTYWCIAGGLVVAGRNTWGARLFGAVALVAATLAVASLGTALWDTTTGTVCGLMFLTSPFVVAGSNLVSPDMLLTLWELLAVLCFWRALRGGGQRWVAGMWAAFGLAFLTKGPPGLLPLAAILLFAFVSRRGGDPVPRIAPVAGLLLFVVIGLGWYLISIVREPALLRYFLGQEVWGRVATGMHHRNARWYMPVVIFGPPLLFGMGAWIVTAWRDARVITRDSGTRAFVRAIIRRRESLFLVLWFALPFAVFCLSKSRLPLYVLPLMPVLALALGRLTILARGPANGALRTWRIALVCAAALMVVKAVSARVSSAQDMLPLARNVRAAGADRVLLLDHPGLYGLQFYLNGNMERCTSSSLRNELSGIDARFASNASHRELLIVPRSAPPLLDRACATGRFSCNVETTRQSELWLLQPGQN